MSQAGGVDRLGGMRTQPTYVVGGGLAGLTAAAALATAGHAVTVLESTSELGGRARSRRRDGFSMNVGPHAVYKGGVGYPILRRLGVPLHGGAPNFRRYGVITGGTARRAARYVATLRRPISTVRAMLGAGSRSARELAGTSVADWLSDAVPDARSRAVVESLVRTTNYAADLDLLDAGAAARQMRNALRGVLYVHGGWQTMVDGLADIVIAHGGTIRRNAPVSRVHQDGQRATGITLDDGTEIDADRIVVAVNEARRAVALIDGPPLLDLEVAAAAAVPIRMAHLDVALRPLPQRRIVTALGLDERVFVSTPSDVADVAPADGAVVSVGRYLAPDEEADDHRGELEAALEAVQPGWTDHVVDVRYVPRSMVAGDHPRVATNGTLGRPTVGIAGVTGLAVAGDWIGPRGALADASVRSGWDAAALVAPRSLSHTPAAPSLTAP